MSSKHERIRELEDENLSLLRMNELYQSELEEKSESFKRALHDYSDLQRLYQELLGRLSDFNESRSATFSPIAGATNEVRQLRAKNQQLEEEIAHLKSQQTVMNDAIQQFAQILRPYLDTTPSSSPTFLIEAARNLSKKLEDGQKKEKTIARIRAERDVLRKYCGNLATEVERNTKSLREIQEVRMLSDDSLL